MANHLEVAKVLSIQTLHAQGWSHRRIARELGIRQNQIYKWKKAFEEAGDGAFKGSGRPVNADPEHEQLRKQLAEAREEIEILKIGDLRALAELGQ